MSQPVSERPIGDGALLGRLFQDERVEFNEDAARVLLQFGFDEEDRRKMHELLVKNQSDALTFEEREQLDSYLRIGGMLDILQARARLALRAASSSQKL